MYTAIINDFFLIYLSTYFIIHSNFMPPVHAVVTHFYNRSVCPLSHFLPISDDDDDDDDDDDPDGLVVCRRCSF